VSNTLNNFAEHVIVIKLLKGPLSFNIFFLKRVILYYLVNSLVIVSNLYLSVKLYIIKLKLFVFIGIILDFICF
jgi:hypothetical protein